VATTQKYGEPPPFPVVDAYERPVKQAYRRMLTRLTRALGRRLDAITKEPITKEP
jgi:hypothetical protein